MVRVVHPLARPYINFQLRDTFGEITRGSSVAVNETVNAHEDAGSSGVIPEAVNPGPIGTRLNDPHAPTVACELLMRRPA